MQVDDMGATAEAVRQLEVIDDKLTRGKKLTQDERGHLRNATAILRTLRDERQAILKQFTEARERLLKPVEAAQPKVFERERLPDDRKSVTRKFDVQMGEGQAPLRVYIVAGRYPDGRIGEVFLKCDKQGTLLSGAFDAVALSISVGLQYGIPLEVFVAKFIGARFEPAGFTGDKKYPMCTSVLDLVARWLKDTDVRVSA